MTLEEVIDSLKAQTEMPDFYKPIIAHLQRIAGTFAMASFPIALDKPT